MNARSKVRVDLELFRPRQHRFDLRHSARSLIHPVGTSFVCTFPVSPGTFKRAASNSPRAWARFQVRPHQVVPLRQFVHVVR
ncbi:MAG: hypothetical protein ACJ73N_11270 [Bryobacteraceae bacterium]